MKKRIAILIICLLSMALTAAAQVSGTWEWKSPMNRKKAQTAFWVTVKQTGTKITGNYSFAGLVDGENDGADGSFVPFAGTIKGGTVTIEFNAEDIHGIEDEPEKVRYKKITSPSQAVLQIKNGRLEWKLTRGQIDTGDLKVPRQVTLKRL